jgi:hypothetical protein
MDKQRLPVTACNRCGRPGYYAIEAKKRCGQVVCGKRCRGRLQLADSKIDWAECPSCQATGWAGETWGRCDGVGWFFVGQKRL